jgi:subtilisin family serine protease
VLPLDLVNLSQVMALTRGRREISVGLIDGPVDSRLADFADSNIRNVSTTIKGDRDRQQAFACLHGNLVAGVLVARRDSAVPAICPACTLLVRPIFRESDVGAGGVPSARPENLAAALIETVDAGARIINLSCGVSNPSAKGERLISDALTYAARQGVIVVAAAGNRGRVGGSCITQHAWVIPVIATDGRGRPTEESNLGASIGQRGLAAPGLDVMSLGLGGVPGRFSGTSVACPFVSGAIALLWSQYPGVSSAQIKLAITGVRRRCTIVPPLMDAWEAFRRLGAQVNN